MIVHADPAEIESEDEFLFEFVLESIKHYNEIQISKFLADNDKFYQLGLKYFPGLSKSQMASKIKVRLVEFSSDLCENMFE